MPAFLSVILKILFIVFFFGFCVFIHEFGHLLVALWKGLHVEKFSVGMGPKLWGFTYRGVEYVISWLPFGGFVSLPQLDPTDTPQSSDNKPLPHATPGARAWTAFAGPLFNVLFGFLLATIMWAAGLWRPVPSTSVVVGSLPAYLPHAAPFSRDSQLLSVDHIPVQDSPPLSWEAFCHRLGTRDAVPQELTLTILEPGAQESREVTFTPEKNPEWEAGVRPGDRILEVNGSSFQGGAEDFQKEYVYGNRGQVSLKVVRQGEPLAFSYVPARNPDREELAFPFMEVLNPVHVAEIRPGSPAEKAGLQGGDQLLSLNHTNLRSPMELEKLLQELPEGAATLEVEAARNGAALPPATLSLEDQSQPTPETLGFAFHVLVYGCSPDSPAAKAGLRQGDQILSLKRLAPAEGATTQPDTLVVREITDFQKFVRESGAIPLEVTYVRDKKERQAILTPYFLPERPGVPLLGVVLTSELPRSIQHVTPWTQFTEVLNTTTRTLGLLFAPLTSRAKSAITGKPRQTPSAQVGIRHMSGPLGIIQALWYKLKYEGYRGGFSFIILISFSLAFMNLLPLPVLDGGHILFAAVEAVTRRRIPATFFKYVYNTFAVLLILMMLYITLFDGRRILRYSRQGTKVQRQEKKQATPAEEPTAAPEEAPAAPETP
ncbi:MAG: site-2 protease family protein [Oligosphaeraceae bacterium]